MPTFIEDPGAEARSLMYRAACICDGERTGIPCKHYWAVIQRFRAANADALRSGEKQRSCTMAQSFLLEWTSEEKPSFCNRYEPKPTSGLVSIVKRTSRRLVGLPPKPGAGYEKFNTDFETFRPMTNEEIARLREEIPDPPSAAFATGKPPTAWTMDDIMSGPQIGILKPGEKPPGQELSPETEKALDEIFSTPNDAGKEPEKDLGQTADDADNANKEKE